MNHQKGNMVTNKTQGYKEMRAFQLCIIQKEKKTRSRENQVHTRKRSTDTYNSVHIKSGVWSPGSIFILRDKQI